MSSLVYGAGALKGLRGYIDGLIMTNAADADHDISIAVGLAQDAANANLIELLSSITKQIDAAWALGTNAGGMFTGAVAAFTIYHVFLIRRSDTGVVDAGFYTGIDPTAVLPAGYDQYRRIGSVGADASANILPFVQNGDHFQWVTPIDDVSVVNLGDAGTLYTLSIPQGIKVQALITANTSHAADNPSVRISSPDTVDATPNPAAAPGATNRNEVEDQRDINSLSIFTNTSGQVRARSSAADTVLDLQTYGWIDARGKQ
jgi:hypothetical protein